MLLPWAFISFRFSPSAWEICAVHACSPSSSILCIMTSSKTEFLGNQRWSSWRLHILLSSGATLVTPTFNPLNPFVFCSLLISSCWNVSALFKEDLKTHLLIVLPFKLISPLLFKFLMKRYLLLAGNAGTVQAGLLVVALALKINVSPPLLFYRTVPIFFANQRLWNLDYFWSALIQLIVVLKSEYVLKVYFLHFSLMQLRELFIFNCLVFSQNWLPSSDD